MSENKFSVFSVDELHTIATALGNAISRLDERVKASSCLSLVEYYKRCSKDADALLEQVNKAFYK
jgi:hypothetical protein